MNKPSGSRIPWQGILAGIGAAVFYTLANVFLRKLAVEIDYVVVVFVKALTTATIFVPWLSVIATKQRKPVMPRGRYIWVMLFGAVQAQIFGNCGQQIALGVIGMAVTVPIYIGSLVASSAFLGYLFLKENISTAVGFALTILVLSVVLLSGGGEAACDCVQKELAASSSLAEAPFFWGVAAAIACGVAFAVLGVCIRYVLGSGVPTQTPLVFVSLTGAIGFGTSLIVRDGVSWFSNYGPDVWLMMIGAGVLNAAAFLCLSIALKFLPVVYVNAINVSQVAMAAAFGVFLFCEPLTTWLVSGLVLMVLGFCLLAKFTARNHQPDWEVQDA